jgi:hypothetical protein
LLFKKTAQGVADVHGVAAIVRHDLQLATFLWIFALREVPLSKAYPFLALLPTQDE